MDAVLTRLGLKEGEAIIHSWINKALEKAQQKVEARNFDMRKNVLKYDNVMNDQRKVVFEQRRDMMGQDSLEEQIDEMRTGVIDDLLARFVPHDSYAESWDVKGLDEALREGLNLDLPVEDWAKEEGIGEEELAERLHKAAAEAYAARTERNTPDVMRYIEKQVVLQMLDHLWREHLVVLDHLRQVIGWRGLAQRDPLNEYKAEAFELFNNGLRSRLRESTTAQLMRVEVAFEPPAPELPPMFASHTDPLTGDDDVAIAERSRAEARGRTFGSATAGATLMAGLEGETEHRDPQDPNTWGRVARNELCPCGSGRKFKHCHGALA